MGHGVLPGSILRRSSVAVAHGVLPGSIFLCGRAGVLWHMVCCLAPSSAAAGLGCCGMWVQTCSGVLLGFGGSSMQQGLMGLLHGAGVCWAEAGRGWVRLGF